jgi:hypothetical protein
MDVIVSTVLTLALTFAPQQSQAPNHQTILPNPNRADRTMARFYDNDERWAVETARREQVQDYRRSVISRRMRLADQLDRMIANGHCEGARRIAQRAGYRDIQDGVAELCDGRNDG